MFFWQFEISLIFSKVFKVPLPRQYDYEAVNEEDLVQEEDDNDDEEDPENGTDDPDYLRNAPPLSALDVDIRIVRQKMSFAEASLEVIRVSAVLI